MRQEQVIGAALDALSNRWGERFRVIAVPDEIERALPAVDMLVEGNGGRQLVVEHTIVESFDDRILDDVLFEALATRVQDLLKGRLPGPGHYRIVLQPGALLRVKKDLNPIALAIAVWAERVAEGLELGSPSSAPRHFMTELLVPWGLEVRLERWPRRDGSVLTSRAVPEDLSDRRRVRIARALQDKCPKLAAARGDTRESILVLESNDLALGNYVEIATAVESELENRHDIPDVVCLGETDAGLVVWLVKERESVFPDITNPGPL